MRVLITGASGYFAGEMQRQMAGLNHVEFIGLTTDPNKIGKKNSEVMYLSNEEFLNEKSEVPPIDIIVHTAFCRKSNGKFLVESLNFERKMVHWAILHGVKGFINLSSQSVFGSEKEELPKEDECMAPGYLYSLAKSVSELLLEEIADGKLAYTNVRLASLMGPSGSVPKNVLYKFICSGLAGEEFKVIGGKQSFSFLDVRDAADAVYRIMMLPFSSWKKSYNLGPEKQTNMLEMADCVCKKVHELTGKKVGYKFIPDDTQLNAGMDSSRLYEAIQWRPKYNFEMIVEDTIKYVMKNEDF